MAQFNFTYSPGTPIEQVIGTEIAGQIWSTFLQDDIEINLHIESTQLEANVLGGALPRIEADRSFGQVRSHLAQDASSFDDFSAVSNLSGNGGSYEATIYDDTLRGRDVALTSANAKALGLNGNNYSSTTNEFVNLSSGGSSTEPLDLDSFVGSTGYASDPFLDSSETLDGVILINSEIDYYHAQSGGAIQADQVDFTTLAVHEIGHALGFISGLDLGDFLSSVQANTEVGREDSEIEVEVEGRIDAIATPLDFFRFSEASASSDRNDFSIGADAFFSVDGGETRLADFSTGLLTELGGDGFQASHFEVNSNTGVLDPTIALGEQRDISDVELRVFDVLGYEVDRGATVDLAGAIATATASAQDAIFADREAEIESLIVGSQVYEARGGGRGNGNGRGRGRGFTALLTNTIEDAGFLATVADAPVDEFAGSIFSGASAPTEPAPEDGDSANAPAGNSAGGGGGAAAGDILGVGLGQILAGPTPSEDESEPEVAIELPAAGETDGNYMNELANAIAAIDGPGATEFVDRLPGEELPVGWVEGLPGLITAEDPVGFGQTTAADI